MTRVLVGRLLAKVVGPAVRPTRAAVLRAGQPPKAVRQELPQSAAQLKAAQLKAAQPKVAQRPAQLKVAQLKAARKRAAAKVDRKRAAAKAARLPDPQVAVKVEPRPGLEVAAKAAQLPGLQVVRRASAVVGRVVLRGVPTPLVLPVRLPLHVNAGAPCRLVWPAITRLSRIPVFAAIERATAIQTRPSGNA